MGRQLYTTKGFLYLRTYPSNYWVEYCWGGDLVSFPLLLGWGLKGLTCGSCKGSIEVIILYFKMLRAMLCLEVRVLPHALCWVLC